MCGLKIKVQKEKKVLKRKNNETIYVKNNNYLVNQSLVWQMNVVITFFSSLF